jgi:hypothetical protein
MRVLRSRRRDPAVSDRIVLTLPSEARFRGVATLVLGGVGSRLDLPYERTDDLQLALTSALEAARDDDVTIEVVASEDGALALAVGPVRNGSGDDSALVLVLSRLVDDVAREHRDGSEWLVLRLSPRSAG